MVVDSLTNTVATHNARHCPSDLNSSNSNDSALTSTLGKSFNRKAATIHKLPSNTNAQSTSKTTHCQYVDRIYTVAGMLQHTCGGQ
jgi:hypothetical protein